MITYSMDKS